MKKKILTRAETFALQCFTSHRWRGPLTSLGSKFAPALCSQCDSNDIVGLDCRFVHEGLDGTELVPKLKLRAPVSALNCISQLCDLLDLHLKPSAAAGAQLLAVASGVSAPKSLAGYSTSGCLLDIFVFCCVWSVGAVVLEPDQGRFVKFLQQLSGMDQKSGPEVAGGSLPADSLYEYRFDVEAGAWKVSRSSHTLRVIWVAWVGSRAIEERSKYKPLWCDVQCMSLAVVDHDTSIC